MNFLLRDAQHTECSPAWSGIFFPSGQQKPSYKSFRFPFVTHRKSKKKGRRLGEGARLGHRSRSSGKKQAAGER